MKKMTVLMLLTMAVTLSACGKGSTIPENSGISQTEQTSEKIGDDSEKETSQTEAVNEEDDKMVEENGTPLQLPILDEIDQNTTVGTAGASLKAVQSAVMLLDWGTFTGLDSEEIKEAAAAWLSDKGEDEKMDFTEKMEAVDAAYQKLIGDNPDARELLESAGCEDAAYPWSDAPVESIEAIMEAVGLR